MGRPARAASSVLLVLVLALLAVPLGIHWATAGQAAASAPVSTPPWQLPPTAPATVQGTLSPEAPLPSSSALAAQLAKTLVPDGGGGDFSGQVVDALSGAVLFGDKATAPRMPASNMKLLTAAAALHVLGPERRFRTQVLRSGPSAIVIKGGGDVLLGAGQSAPDAVMGHAGLATLATQTVSALQTSGAKGRLSVAVDTALFTGPALNPAVEKDDVAAGETAPVAPLALNSGRFKVTDTAAPRPEDQGAEVLKAFTDALNSVAGGTGLSFVAGGAAGTGVELASVDSATVAEQVGWMLQNSDNFLAAVLGRMVSLGTGGPGSYAGAIQAVTSQLEGLGVDTHGMVISDLSGLAPGNRVSAAQFTSLIRLMTSGDDPSLRAALDGFPVAAVSGTLGSRYDASSSKAGAGLVRAKTGTLNTVLSLSGYVVDADGRLLLFSFIGNGLTPGAAGNKPALDASAAVLAGCGCR
ncbi:MULTISPECIES: D-alanyl-D-alanine carboxypeptidase/D-alanyl-D-alanine-endopeptidase [Arthrobacter]|uniref:D-alanyl-D-alanine carboxypeptidase/D-alanyl-D-alanine-endopeptidase n=2 Tax=Arthrobacter TaxID=1663 RepID=A0ABU9KIQ2_9MICC|nr:D-alanyl-D-alanine carboxypeptidase/D-alanyl-D-alanine-endopeptidase [Arthrobacter sp. YJM1]MDP5226986.1 D-alanyl-D-alanine carboxypeptidase/D-alanyl-D-alanine-endopeptidase [Arthrobacter sp. YJM1]